MEQREIFSFTVVINQIHRHFKFVIQHFNFPLIASPLLGLWLVLSLLGLLHLNITYMIAPYGPNYFPSIL